MATEETNRQAEQVGALSSMSSTITDTTLTQSTPTQSTIQLPQAITPFGVYIRPVTEYAGQGGQADAKLMYPNDIVKLDLYNNNNVLLETNYRIATFTILNNKVTLDVEKDVTDLGYIAGKYKVQYSFHRNLLGSGDTQKIRIQEISANGLEVRVVPVLSAAYNNFEFINFFGRDFFKLKKSNTLVNLFLFKDTTTSMGVFDYTQDPITIENSPFSIIFKLNSPVPLGINTGDFLWLAQQVSDNITDTISITPPKIRRNQTIIAGPNWDILAKQATGTATQYKNRDSILTANIQTSQDIINKILSSSFLEGITLNIDYREFKNHNHFGSAEQRLQNFKYKMQLLESYDSRVQSLTTGLSGLLSGSASSSIYYKTNVIDAQTKQAALLGSMDGYEKYLLKESSSYESSSYGDFYPSTWPKTNNTKPYINYSYTSSQVADWFSGIITSASLYDQNNDNALYKLIPSHIQNDPNNDQYLLFVQMIGHYFDIMFAYIKQINKNTDRQESILEGFSKDLIYHISRNLGIDFENGMTIDELWSYLLGTESTGAPLSTFAISTEDKTKEIWKRVINNLPHLLKTKGTERGLRALINCFGIPQTILRIREYGGAEANFESKTDNVYERFFYSTTVGYNGKTSGQVAQLIEAPWVPLTVTNTMPSTVELRVKMAKDQTKTQTIFEVPNKWQVKAFQSASNNYIGFFLSGSQGYATASVSSSIYENVFHHIALERSVASDSSSTNQTYTLIVKRVNYLKVTSTVSASLYIDGSTSSSYNTSYTSTGSLWIPGSGSFLAATSQSMNILSGSVQELKYWTTPLQDAILDNHALAPTSFQGNLTDTHTGSTSSFYSLGFRLCLGADNKKVNLATTSSINSQHPDQTKTGLSGSFYNFSGSYFNPVVEIHSLEWPDLGGNRSVSNKIKIDATTLSGGNQLYRNTKTEVALSDNSPIDSPRLGVYLSPLNEINQDIAEQFGGLSIDDFIGNPADLNDETYPDLEKLQREYFKKYGKKAGTQNYIRLLKNFDAALFKLVKKFVPYRANTQVGLVIEPTILQRSKLPTRLPTFEELHYSGSIALPDLYTVGGFVQDGDGEPSRDGTGYVPAGTIAEKYAQISGEDFLVAEGTIGEKHTTLIGVANEFNNTGIANNPSGLDNTAGTVDFGISGYGRDTRVLGSQYVFMTHMVSQSAFVSYYGASTYDTTYVYSTQDLLPSQLYLVTASRYDYHDPINPTIIDSGISSIANVANVYYNTNIFYLRSLTDTNTYGSVSASAKTIYTSSVALYENNWTSKYGLRVETLKASNVLQSTPFTSSAFWGITGSLGLFFENTTTSIAYTGSVKLPAFYYKEDEPRTHDYLYTITVVVGDNRASGTSGKIELHFGNLDCILTGSMVPTNTDTTYTFTTLATGPWLGLRVYTAGQTAYQTYIKSLKIQPLNYRSQTQDFHLQNSKGMLNARYNGCKLTSPDWNINSNIISSTYIGNLPPTASLHTTDNRRTIDGGPVVLVTVGGGQQLRVKPGVKGNFKVSGDNISNTPSPGDLLG